MVVYKDKRFIKCDLFPNTDWIGDADFILDDNDEKDSKIEEKIISLYPNFEFVFDDGESEILDVIKTTEPIENIISQKKAELSAECEKVIVAGVDVNDAHYSLTIEDQANILAWMSVAQTGKSVPYHQDGQPCRIFTPEEFLEVANAAVVHKTHHTTYCNLLMRQVEDMTNADDVKAVKYGITELTGDYAAQYNLIMSSLSNENDTETVSK